MAKRKQSKEALSYESPQHVAPCAKLDPLAYCDDPKITVKDADGAFIVQPLEPVLDDLESFLFEVAADAFDSSVNDPTITVADNTEVKCAFMALSNLMELAGPLTRPMRACIVEAFRLGTAYQRLKLLPAEPLAVTGQKMKHTASHARDKRSQKLEKKRLTIVATVDKHHVRKISRDRARQLAAEELKISKRTVEREEKKSRHSS